MSIKTYTSISESYNINNFFDIYDDNFNKIRFAMQDKQLYITAYDITTLTWSPATIICDNLGSNPTTSLLDFSDLLLANNVRIQLDAEIPANGSELLIFEKTNNYNNIRRSNINLALSSSENAPTVNNDNKIVVYELDSNGDPRLTLSSISTNNLANSLVTLADDQVINSMKTFSMDKFRLGGNNSNITLNGSQAIGSSSYSLEFPTAAPSGTLNVLTTSGSSPYSKLSWTNLSNYTLNSSFDQLSSLNTTGSPSFANLTISSSGALNLNYMSTPASSDILATLNVNKQLTNSGVALSSLCTIGTAQTITADKTFNYTAGKIKLSNYSTDNTTTNNVLTLNASGYIVPCNKLYSDISPFSTTVPYTFTATQTFSAASNPLAITNLSSAVTTDNILSINSSGNVTKSNVVLSNLCLLGTTQTITSTKTFNLNTLALNGNGSANVTLNAPNISSAYTWTLPSSNPTSGTTNVLTTVSTTSPYTLSWSDISTIYLTQTNAASTYLTQTNAASTYLTQTNAASTYMKLNATQTNAGINTWSGNNTFNQDKLLLPTLTATASGTYVLTKNASTGAVEYASSVAWNNINLINSAQTITAVKTFDYTTAKIALTNTTNDNVTTNKVLVLNASNQIVPCDKTYASITASGGGGGSTVGTLNASASTDQIVAINTTTGTLTTTAIPFDKLSTLTNNVTIVNNINATPVYHFKFDQNLNSSGSAAYGGSSTGTFTYDANGKYGYSMKTTNGNLTSSLTSLNSSSGNSITVSAWVKATVLADSFRIQLGSVYFMMNGPAVIANAGTKNGFYMNDVTGYSSSYNLGLNDPDFTTTAGINKWWFFGFTWDSVNLKLSIYFSDGGSNVYSNSKTYTTSTFTNTLNTNFRNVNQVNFTATTAGILVDDMRFYNVALSTAALADLAIAPTTDPNVITPSIIYNTGSQTILGNKTIDYANGSLALSNTTNDTTSTNKILTLNTITNKIVPCDKTYASISATVYNGYALIPGSNGNKKVSIIVTNPLSATAITVNANISKTLDGDGNYVQFDNVLTTITASNITFNISANTEWVIDNTNTYTLFYSIITNPASNPAYSYTNVTIPNLVNYFNFESGSGNSVDLVALSPSPTFTGTYTTPAKYGTYGIIPPAGYYTFTPGTIYTFCTWIKFHSSQSYLPNLHTTFTSGDWNDVNYSSAALTNGIGTLKFTWAGQTSATVNYNGTIFNHIAITITAGGLTELYWNGVLLISTNVTNLLASGTNAFRYYIWGDRNEVLDDIRVYNRVLAPTEVAALASATSPSNILYNKYSMAVIPNLVSYWNFNSNVADQVGAQVLSGTPTYNTSLFKYGTAAINKTSTVLTTTLSSYVSYYGISLSFWLNNITNAAVTINPAALTELNINTTNITASTFQLGISGGTLSSAQYSPALTYSSSKWMHISAIIDFAQKTICLFCNGQLALTYTATDTYFSASSWTAPVISLNKNGSANIDELRIYNRILNDNEIGPLYSLTPASIQYLAVPAQNAAYNGYAPLTVSSGNRKTTIIVTNPLASTSITVTANISKTLDGDGNYVLFDNVLPVISASTIAFSISANTEWIIDSSNAYTLFYTILPNPTSNPSYSYSELIISDLFAYANFENPPTTINNANTVTSLKATGDAYGKISFNDYGGNAVFSTTKKWGSYGLTTGGAFQMNLDSATFTAMGNNYTVAFWHKISVTTETPNLTMRFASGDTSLTCTSQGTTPATMKFTNWGTFTVPNPPAVSLDTNFHHYAFVINTATTTCQFYMDGILLISMPMSNLNSGATSAYTWYFNNSQQITLDDFRMYKRCLTSSEITALKTLEPSGIKVSTYTSINIPDLLSYWPFNSNLASPMSNVYFTGTPTYNTTTYKYGTACINRTSTELTTTLSSFGAFNGVSISFWANYFTNSILTISPSTATDLYIKTINNTGTTMQLGISGGTMAANEYSKTLSYSNSNWYHVVLNIDFTQKTIRLFLNGVPIMTYSTTDTYLNANTWIAPVITLNKTSIGSANIDELRIYSRLLTDLEISHLYAYNPASIQTISTQLQKLDIYDTTGNNFFRLSVLGGAIMAKYYVGGVPIGNSYALTVPVILPPSPAIAWNFNSTLTSTYSTSGSYAFNGTASFVTGKFGTALTSVGSRLTTTDLTPFSRASGYSYTISFWFKFSSALVSGDNTESRVNLFTSNDIGRIMALRTGNSGLMNIDSNGGSSQLLFPQTTYGYPAFGFNSTYSTNWNFYTCSWNDDTATMSYVLYVNGIKYSGSQVITDATIISYIRTTARYKASAPSYPQVQFEDFSGKILIDDLRLWPTALTAAQIDLVYSADNEAITYYQVAPTPVVSWNFNTNRVSNYSTVGSYSFNSGSIAANGKFGNCFSLVNSASITTEITPFTTAGGYSCTMSFWFKYSATFSGSSEVRINLIASDNNARIMLLRSFDNGLVYIDNNYGGAPNTLLFPVGTLPSFNLGTNYASQWSFFAFKWDDAITTISYTIYVNNTKYSFSQVITDSTALSTIRKCTRRNGSIYPQLSFFDNTGNLALFDDMRMWPTALSDSEITLVYNSTSDS